MTFNNSSIVYFTSLVVPQTMQCRMGEWFIYHSRAGKDLIGNSHDIIEVRTGGVPTTGVNHKTSG